MTGRKGKTSYPTGGAPWIAHVYKWLEEHPEWSQARLARKVGLEPPSLNGMLKGKIRQSWAVPSINRIVGYQVQGMATGTTDETDALTQLAAVMAQLEGEDEEAVREQVEAALKTARRLLKNRPTNDS